MEGGCEDASRDVVDDDEEDGGGMTYVRGCVEYEDGNSEVKGEDMAESVRWSGSRNGGFASWGLEVDVDGRRDSALMSAMSGGRRAVARGLQSSCSRPCGSCGAQMR